MNETVLNQIEGLKQQLKNTETLYIKIQGALEALESLTKVESKPVEEKPVVKKKK